MRNPHENGPDPNDHGTDPQVPANQQKWPPEGFLVTSLDLKDVMSLASAGAEGQISSTPDPDGPPQGPHRFDR